MAFIKISELPALNNVVSPLTAGDIVPLVHGPTTYKVTMSAMQDYFGSNFNVVAPGNTGYVIINVADQLSAYPGFVYLPSLSALQIGDDNVHGGVLGGILGGTRNTNNSYNAFVIGSNIYALYDNHTYVNNLSAQLDLKAGRNLTVGSATLGSSNGLLINPTMTIAQLSAITGEAGQFVSVSNASLGGMLNNSLAFWSVSAWYWVMDGNPVTVV